MQTNYLAGIHTPADVKKMDHRQLEQLCGEIRAFLIQNVSKTGGHLSSNLGVVELTVALHRVFASPEDQFVFDVGHQCYTHKLLTGRQQGFEKLRMAEGLSGFPCPEESEHDIFKAGHGSTALSAAVGLAQAKKLQGKKGKVIVIIGDGAFTGGMIYEALNNLEGLDNLVVVLNDNKMSISKNDGAVAHYFTRLRTSPGYYKAKTDVKSVLDNTPIIGESMVRGIKSMKSMVRRGIYHSTFFEELGFSYLGPMDGHDIPGLCNVFQHAKEVDEPLFVHVETVKGKGFRPAEQNPGAFHGVSSFNTERIQDPDISPDNSFSTQFGQELAALANENKRVCAITAAMKYGTGLQYFKKSHPARFFDVGMTEQHAVTFAAGLARGGMLPVVAIYSTFLQRSYDQIIHDVMLQNLDVLFAIDRAGLVPGDGETHQGIYDAAYLSQQKTLPIVSPANYTELRYWLDELVESTTGPRAIRYPRGGEPDALAGKPCSGKRFDCLLGTGGARAAVVTYGTLAANALGAAELYAKNAPKQGELDIYQMVWINPIPQGLVEQLLAYDVVYFPEEGITQGGIGEHLGVALQRAGYKGIYRHTGLPNTGIDHASTAALKAAHGLDAEGICAAVTALVRGEKA